MVVSVARMSFSRFPTPPNSFLPSSSRRFCGLATCQLPLFFLIGGGGGAVVFHFYPFPTPLRRAIQACTPTQTPSRVVRVVDIGFLFFFAVVVFNLFLSLLLSLIS